MKTINVSEDALNTIKRMAEEREQEIEILRESIRAIRDIAQNQDIGKAWATVQNLCNQALSG
jgi:SMC interacting uncharacterized protein involved in chromosome segregation